jgi:hypothetical protein
MIVLEPYEVDVIEHRFNEELNPNLTLKLGIWFCYPVDKENKKTRFITNDCLVNLIHSGDFSLLGKVNFVLFIEHKKSTLNIHFDTIYDIQKRISFTNCQFSDLIKDIIKGFDNSHNDLLGYVERKLLQRLVPYVTISKYSEDEELMFSLDPLCGSQCYIRKNVKNENLSWIFAK